MDTALFLSEPTLCKNLLDDCYGIVYDLLLSSTEVQVCRSRHGGKIGEKANVPSNVGNTLTRVNTAFVQRPIKTVVGEKLNSLGLRKISTLPVLIQDPSTGRSKETDNPKFDESKSNL